MATIKDIAKKVNVSISTVSRVLNRDETLSVSSQVREQILLTAKELKYIPPKMRHASQSEELIIGVADWHIVRKDRHNIDIAQLDNIVTMMSVQEQVRFVRMSRDEKREQLDGIIAFGNFTDEEIKTLRMQSNHIVFINSRQDSYEFDTIVMDYDNGINSMIDYLVDYKDYRSIGYLGGIYNADGVTIGTTRLTSLKEVLTKRDMYCDKYFYIGEMSSESGRKMALKIIESGDIPEVLILGSDEIAEGALEVIKEHRLRIPKDVAVVIYKDIDTVKTKYPTYTRLDMLPRVVWTTSVNMLIEQIKEKREDSMKVFLSTKLQLGDSA